MVLRRGAGGARGVGHPEETPAAGNPGPGATADKYHPGKAAAAALLLICRFFRANFAFLSWIAPIDVLRLHV